jgi:hypothetical protein
MDINELKTEYEESVIGGIVDCWQLNIQSIRNDNETVGVEAMKSLERVYSRLLELCGVLPEEDTKLKIQCYKLAVRFSEMLGLHSVACNLSRLAVETKHGRKWFRGAINRNKNLKDNDGKKGTQIDLSELTDVIEAKYLI